MSEGLLPLVLAGAVLLLVAGLPKVADPRDTVSTMPRLRTRESR